MNQLDRLTPHEKKKVVKEITVKKLWEAFAESTLTNISKTSVQYQECEKMWFTGFSEGLRMMSVLVDAVSEEEACEKLSQFHKETEAYYKEMATRAGMGHFV